MGGFRKFLLRGNLVDLAVAVVVGVAFNQVVQALIKDLITPVIGVLGGKPNFSGLRFTIDGNHFRYGDFINVELSFLIIVAVPANRVAVLAERKAEATERPCPECLSNIPAAATRCKFCTAAVEPKVNGHAAEPPLASLRRQWATWRPRS